MITGVSMPRWRSSRSTSKPLMRGSITSSRTQVERLAGGALEPALAVGARLDAVALAGEPVGQRQDEPRFILDEQQPLHVMAAVPRASTLAVGARPASSFADGRRHRERAALPRLALHADTSAVRLDDALDEAQAESGALNLRCDDVGGAIERLEDRAWSAGAMPMPRSAR